MLSSIDAVVSGKNANNQLNKTLLIEHPSFKDSHWYIRQELNDFFVKFAEYLRNFSKLESPNNPHDESIQFLVKQCKDKYLARNAKSKTKKESNA